MAKRKSQNSKPSHQWNISKTSTATQKNKTKQSRTKNEKKQTRNKTNKLYKKFLATKSSYYQTKLKVYSNKLNHRFKTSARIFCNIDYFDLVK